jgi:hypothetical protein
MGSCLNPYKTLRIYEIKYDKKASSNDKVKDKANLYKLEK